MQLIIKPAYNEEYRICEFRRSDGQGQLAADEIITSCSILMLDSAGADVTSAMIAGVTPNNSTQVLYELKGGAAGTRYVMHVRVITSSNQKLEEAFSLRVI